RLSWTLVLIGGGVSLVAAVLGGGGAVRRAASLPPAEAMRPEPPPRFSPGWIERTGLGTHLSTGGRLILRNLERRPLRAALSSLGVAFSVAILVIGMFLFDGVELAMDQQFHVAQREDLTVTFIQELSEGARHDLAREDGVVRVEPFLTVPVRLRAGHRERELAITGLEVDGRLRRIVGGKGDLHALPLQGLLLSAFLAERLGLTPGDTVRVETLVGRRRAEPVAVVDVVEDLLGVAAWMNVDALRRITRDGNRISGAYLLTDGRSDARLSSRLKEAPMVAGVVSPRTMLESFRQQVEDSLYVAVFFIVGFASIISVAVIYNGTRIALSERGRELASLRVLGFSRGEVGTLLFGEQAVITVLAIPFGWIIGYGLAYLVVTSMASETYRIPLVVSAQTYFWTAVITLVAATASAALVRRRLHRMDLIAVLKTRE
ncbi:MAG: FtsX-like permease family protein, partial [Longimicrobiales bacterium]|nr:FtsX-like permease family protein [Longimicrobiales bacterium]